jgi:phytoene synthase
MQLTNILRDVGEDLRRGRVYLPSHDLTAAGCGPGDLRRQVMSEGLREVMRDITAEARERYRRGMAGLIYLDASTRFSIYLAARLYSKILDKIEQRDYQVLTERVRLTGPEKWLDTVAGYFQYRRLPAFLESDATEV